MKLKDKIKTVAIGMVTAVMTSCGFKSNEAKVIERNPDEHAFNLGTRTDRGAKSYSPGAYIIDSGGDDIQLNRPRGEDSIDIKMRKEWQEKLDNAGIPIAKKGENDTDSLLVGVEERNGKLQNPVYGLNPKTEVNDEESVNIFDEKSFGMESVETVYERVSRNVNVVDRNTAKKLSDKFGGFIVEEDGKSPKVNFEYQTSAGARFKLNYRQNSKYKDS